MGQITQAFGSPFKGGYAPGVDVQENTPVGAVASLGDDTGTINTGATAHDAAAGTYNFTAAADRMLNVFFSVDNGASYKKATITGIVGAAPATTSAAEVAALLMANGTFSRSILAANAAGTLRLTAKMPSARFKMYFTGTAAAKLAGVFTTAIAPGSAVTGANVAGKALEFTVTDQRGIVLADFPVFVTGRITTVGGTVSATCNYGLISKGSIIAAAEGGNSAVPMLTDKDGKVAFYVADTAAEVLQTVVVPGHATAPLAVLCQGAGKVTFS